MEFVVVMQSIVKFVLCEVVTMRTFPGFKGIVSLKR